MSRRRKQLTFDTVNTETEAQELVARINRSYTKYTRRKTPAKYEMVHDQNGNEIWVVTFYRYW